MISEPERPQIELDFDGVFCERHREPFRARWPRGYAIAAMALFECWIGSDDAAEVTDGELRNVREALRVRPLCCRVRPEDLLRAYKRSGIGRMRRCRMCGHHSAGTPLTGTDWSGRTIKTRHVCFRCAARKVQE